MIRNKPAEHTLQIVVFAVIVVVSLLQIVACRGLYADGTDALIRLLDARDLVLSDAHRALSDLIIQLPLIFALKLGVNSLTILRFLFSGWILALPILYWLLALYELRGDFLFWPFVMLFCFVYYTTCFLAISEFSLCYGLVACCLAALLRRKPLMRFDRIVLLVAAALLPLSYAATLFYGPMLLLALWKMDVRRHFKGNRYHYALALLFFASFVTGAWEVLTPRATDNFAAARDPAMLFEDLQFWIVLLYAAAAGAGFFVRPMFRPYLPIFCLILIVPLIVGLEHINPFFSYGVRMYVAIAFFFWGLGLIWFRWRGWRRLDARKLETYSPTLLFVAPVFAVFLVLSFCDADLSLRYASYIDQFRAEVNSRTGLVPYEQTGLYAASADITFGRMWTYPAMSIVLRDNADKAIILNPWWFHGYQPFNPFEHVPDLSRYYDAR